MSNAYTTSGTVIADAITGPITTLIAQTVLGARRNEDDDNLQATGVILPPRKPLPTLNVKLPIPKT